MEVDGDILLMHLRAFTDGDSIPSLKKNHHPGSHDHTWNFNNLLSLETDYREK